MKQSLLTTFLLIIGLNACSQKDSIRGNKFQLTAKIKTKVQMAPHCGTIAWGTVVDFDIIHLSEMSYPIRTLE